MSALAMDLYTVEEGTCQYTIIHDRDLARRQAVHHMRTIAGIHVDLLLIEIIQQMTDTTLSHFLCFFEHEKYLAFPFVLVCCKDLRRGEEHRHVSVMPTGMRDAVILREAHLFACKILRILFDRQRIDIGSHQDRPAILPAVDHAKDTTSRYTDRRDPPAMECFFDEVHGLPFLLRQLRIFMEMTAKRNEKALLSFDCFLYIHYDQLLVWKH